MFRDQQNPLTFPDDFLHERCRFSSEGVTHLCQHLEPYVASGTRRSNALTVPQTVSIALHYFSSFAVMYVVGGAENTVSIASPKVAHALTGLLDAFVMFPGHLPTLSIKEGFYDFAGRHYVTA